MLQPAIELAEQGFPVAPIAAHSWKASEALLRRQAGGSGHPMLQPDGHAPKAGDIHKNPDLAATFRTIAEKGAYDGGLSS